MSFNACELIATRPAEVLDEGLVADGLPQLRLHAAECAPCSKLLAEHRAILTALASLAIVPADALPTSLSAPSLDFRRPLEPVVASGPVLSSPSSWRPLAAAAALLLAITALAGAWSTIRHNETARTVSSEQAVLVGFPVVVESIESARIGVGVPDEELLSLTSGWDAVASLRPALAQ